MSGLRKIETMLLAGPAAGGLLAASSAADLKAQDRRAAQAIVLRQSEGVLGKDLVSASGQSAGRIVDVLADESGRVRAVLAGYGGFPGAGGRRIAIAWSGLHFGPESKSGAATVDIPPERLSRAPEVRAGKPVVAVNAHASAGTPN